MQVNESILYAKREALIQRSTHWELQGMQGMALKLQKKGKIFLNH